jgi:hypothetical protein
MVYVFPNSLRISPTDPLNTEKPVVSAYIAMDYGGLLNFPCGAGIGYTKTYIHLLRRVADIGQTWAKADEVAIYDCSTQCCLNLETLEDSIPGNPGQYGWYIEFPPLHVMPAKTTYEFLVIDDGDFKNLTTVDASRTATLRVTIQQDPAQILVPPISTGDGTTECDSGDYMCLYKDYIPYAVVGVILLLLLSGGKK